MSAEAAPSRSEAASALAAGTRLGEYELLGVLGIGGFGIVYKAFDHALEREVAIKEYLPASLVGRTETLRVSLRSASDEESFALGRKSFINEAKLLARFDHPSLLKVYRFWEDNGTAYMAMPILRGRTLKQLRQAHNGPFGEAELRAILVPLLGAIETLHREGVFHRDIAPDNVQVEPDGRPVLMDFGAARQVLSDKTQSLTAILKPAYAPIEQYGEAGAVRQGPWTDLYALGATLHYMLVGRPPAPATARTVDDSETLLTRQALPQCSEGFLQAVQWMLRPRPADRPQSVAALREALEGRAAPPQPEGSAEMRTQLLARPGMPPVVPAALTQADAPTELIVPPSRPAPGEVSEHVWLEPERTALVPPGGVSPAAVAPPAAAPAGPARAPSRLPWVVGLGLLAVAAVALATWWPLAPEAAPAAAAEPTPAAPGPATTPVAEAAAGLAPAPGPAASVPLVSDSAGAAAASETTALVPAAVAGESPVVAQPTAMETPPAPAPARRTEARPARETAAATSPPRTPARPAPEPVPIGPGPDCGPRDGVRHLVCMERECAAPRFANHPVCERLRQ